MVPAWVKDFDSCETATKLTKKFRRDVWRVSQDKVRGPIVKRLRMEFANAPALRARKTKI